MEVVVRRVELPDWTTSGYGYGYGYGDGYGYGSGDGSSADITACAPRPVPITAQDLADKNACGDQRKKFIKAFPDGAIWPRDVPKAREIGLDVNWAVSNFGFMLPVP